jgi:formylglycine-generating enzyme required for sulfatase activity
VCRFEASAGSCVATHAPASAALDEVVVAAGSFWMGCNATLDPACESDEAPQHEVSVPAFAIGRTEVTAAAYAAFLTAHGNTCGPEPCVDTSFGKPPLAATDGTWTALEGKENLPMTEVTWYGARELCAWIGGSLPSEAEWEKAARGGCALTTGECAAGMRVYPWGNAEPSCELAIMHAEGDWGCGTGGLWPVGSKPGGASPYGALDLAGNAWEWVRDSYQDSYQGAPPDGSARDPGGDGLRVIRGGGLISAAAYLRASERDGGGAGDSSENRGFRCARPLE